MQHEKVWSNVQRTQSINETDTWLSQQKKKIRH